MGVGGLTPDASIIEAIRSAVPDDVTVLAMVRPRDGLFDYDAAEIRRMAQSIRDLAKAGAHGVVFGVVRDGMLDLIAMEILMDTSHSSGVQVTMHRAFDALSTPENHIASLTELGVQRILTSGAPWGSAASASNNLGTLIEYLGKSPEGIEWVIGGGVDHENAPHIMDSLRGTYSLHAYSSVLSDYSVRSDHRASADQVVNPDLVRQLRHIIEARTPGAH